jgi:hypothetical protein
MRRALITSFCILMLAWLGLVGSEFGIVVWQSAPFASTGHSRSAIRCTYFNGTGFFKRGYLYSPSDRVGYARCPLWAPSPI